MKNFTVVHAEPESPLPFSSKLFRNVKGIIFDFDGTLFDNVRLPFYLVAAYPPDLLRLWRERLVRRSFVGSDYATPDEYYRAYFTALGKACFRSPESMRAWYFNRFMPRMTKVLKKHYKFRPGVIELFMRVHTSGIAVGQKALPPDFPKLAIYSDYPFLKERLEALGLGCGPKTLLYGPDSFGAQKPAVRPFLKIASDLGVKPEEVLVIGDREDTDGIGAHKAGMHFFCVETGRKRYFRLDPNRQPPEEKPHGPSMVMYAGTWGDLAKMFIDKWGSKNDQSPSAG